MVSFCFCAKFRTCACANLMSSRSRLATWPIARSTSPPLSLKAVGDHLSNFSDNARTAASPLASTSARIASTVWRTCGIGRLDGAGIHAAFEMASHGSLLPVVSPGPRARNPSIRNA